MNPRALHALTYGIHLVSARHQDRANIQVTNTLIQVASEPVLTAVAINRKNYTHDLIEAAGRFAATILERDTPLDYIARFGFSSGRDTDKLAGLVPDLTPAGIPYLSRHAVAWLEVRVVERVRAGTHTLYLGEVTAADISRDGEPLTYAHYRAVKKGAVPATAPITSRRTGGDAMGKYVCAVCGYEYDPAVGDPDQGIARGTAFADLPADWVCPVCGAGKDQFSPA